ncbi:hypothetical protein GCM10020221_34250 [Streptomyces thioluteus]|uniref:Uncharacterized protein n=1 Tax=Streptomyces thioluteus TaxID=66431 RepID=A0ABP6JJL3_STRTU
MASPVPTAAATAAPFTEPPPRTPHRATPTSPADATATPASCHPSGNSPANRAASTVTASGAVPRAMGYICPKSPSENERISNIM